MLDFFYVINRFDVRIPPGFAGRSCVVEPKGLEIPCGNKVRILWETI